MNPVIKEQLEKCQFASVPYFDEHTTHLVIPKQVPQGDAGLQIDHYYQIELADYLLNPPPDYSFHINWNGGNIPKDRCLRAYPCQKLGSMVKVDACGYDPKLEQITDNQYLGFWFPMDGIKIIKEIQ